MLSFTARRNLFGTLSNNTQTATLAVADILINQEEKRILSSRQWTFLEKQFTCLTDSANQFVTLPQYVDRVASTYVTIGNYNWTPKEVASRSEWDRLNIVTVTSNTPTYYYVYDGKIGFFPKPSTSSYVITINGKELAKDLTVADYTAGTITTLANGSATVTGSGTSWNQQMAGRWLQITDGNTTGTGDGYWYQILSVTNTTSLTLVRNYAGTSISGGSSAYTIAQCSLIPEQYQDLPIYAALQTFYTSIDPDVNKAQLFGSRYAEIYKMLEGDYTVKNQSCVIDDGSTATIINPNLTITL